MTSPDLTLRTFSVKLQNRINCLSNLIHGRSLFPNYRPPGLYTGELIGVDYLYSQSDMQMPTVDSDLNKAIDEGFEDMELEDDCLELEDPTMTLPDGKDDLQIGRTDVRAVI